MCIIRFKFRFFFFRVFFIWVFSSPIISLQTLQFLRRLSSLAWINFIWGNKHLHLISDEMRMNGKQFECALNPKRKQKKETKRTNIVLLKWTLRRNAIVNKVAIWFNLFFRIEKKRKKRISLPIKQLHAPYSGNYDSFPDLVSTLFQT